MLIFFRGKKNAKFGKRDSMKRRWCVPETGSFKEEIVLKFPGNFGNFGVMNLCCVLTLRNAAKLSWFKKILGSPKPAWTRGRKLSRVLTPF